MSSKTKVTYKKKGFWILEQFIERLSEYICETFETVGLSDFSPNLLEIYDICDGNRRGHSIGMVGFMFDDYITSESDRNAFINILEQTKLLIQSKGTEISIEILNQFEANKSGDYSKIDWALPIRTQSLIATIGIIEELLNETWQSSTYPVYYIGWPHIEGFEQI